jgi:Aspartyl protease
LAVQDAVAAAYDDYTEYQAEENDSMVMTHNLRWSSFKGVSARRFCGACPMPIALSLAFILGSIFCFTAMPDVRAASSQRRSEKTAVQVFATPDESSLVLESIIDGESPSPLAEMIGAGGSKWFMVKTGNGNVGWIKAGDHDSAKKIDSHFRSLPNENLVFSLPKATSRAPATGAGAIPVQVSGSRVIVSVNFNNSTFANLLLDTGASRTMISSRIAKILRLQSIGFGRGYGIGGTVTVSTARLDSVKLGEMERQNLLVMIHDFSPDPSYEGLLGFDFLSHFHISLDLQKSLLVLTPRNG